MITVQLQGGLGNQMFQYAFGRALALRTGSELCLDLSFLKKKAEGYTQREFSLNVFPIQATIADEVAILAFEKAGNRDFFSRIKRKISDNRFITVRESGFEYQEVPVYPKKNVRYIGFWQSEKYFHSIRSTLLQDFHFSVENDPLITDALKKTESCDAISLHIRRGDYITNSNAHQFHGTCSDDYYYKGVEILKQGLNRPEIFIFSDDPDWVRKNMSFDIPAHYMDFNTQERSHLDMYLMSRCAHHIIANSSFSWWGAWLNESDTKKVIAPKQWFNDSSVHTQDLIPSAWQRI